MWWLAYLIIFGKRRSPCETQPPAEPAEDRATTASSDHPEVVAIGAITVSAGDGVDIVVITDETTRGEIEEALTYLAATAARLPRHYVDRKAAIHARIDALLDDLELLEALEA